LKLIFTGVLLLALDQSSKALANARAIQPITCGSIFQIRYVINQRRFYQSPFCAAVLSALWVVALASALALHWSKMWFQSASALAGLGCALGGAAGNLLDIAWRKQIVDFIDLGWWPVFNLADVAIVGGLMLAFLS
jgi:signal peptidase II